jgi:hypothetical protein
MKELIQNQYGLTGNADLGSVAKMKEEFIQAGPA